MPTKPQKRRSTSPSSTRRPPPRSTAKPASHDTATPQALLDFMMRDWKAASAKTPPAIDDAAAFAARRRALSKRFPAETLVIPTGHEKVRANDTTYRFRPGSDFYYLTGNVEPDCVLVMQPKEGGGHRDLLFVEPNPGRSDPTFFTDRAKGELWVGARLGVPQSQARYAVHECRGLPDLPALLESLQSGHATRPHRVLRGLSEKVDGAVRGSERDKELATTLSEMRLRKDDVEVKELSRAIASTKRGFEDVIRALGPAGTAMSPGGARSEREVEGVFGLRARVEGAEVGYGTIAASGPHACILHWTRNDGRLKKQNLLLLDAGIERETLYTADITRTLPIGGRFGAEQRAVYELVLAAQHAALRAVRPGADFLDPHRAAMRVLAEGLVRLGVLSCSADEALREENQLHKRYTLHNVSHMLGLDVHDCAQARQEVYRYGKLAPGMVLTIEPGLYFQEDDLTVPARYRGIGVRIEDDVLVTPKGARNLSADIPTGADEIEAWMAAIWARG
jgi:Xaa-Pro aminopeptidase